MRAMVFHRPGQPLTPEERAVPAPPAGEVLIRISACGVCRTDLHIVDGELAEPNLPLVPGHEAVGRIERLGAGVDGLAEGERVGMPWPARISHPCHGLRRAQAFDPPGAGRRA